MKPTRAGIRLRLRAALFALSIAAMAAQAGSVPRAPPAAGAVRVPRPTVTLVPLALERGLEARLARVLRRPPVSGSWALLIAGLTGVWAIGQRRMTAAAARSLDPRRLQRR